MEEDLEPERLRPDQEAWANFRHAERHADMLRLEWIAEVLLMEARAESAPSNVASITLATIAAAIMEYRGDITKHIARTYGGVKEGE